VSFYFWRRWEYTCVYVCVYAHIHTHYTWGAWCELRVWDEILGGPEESRWTKSQQICIRICVQSTHMYIYGVKQHEIWTTSFFGSRWGWIFLERIRILSGIQFTRHFIKSIVVETKQFVSSNLNVILTQQTCGQRSNSGAESKRRVLETKLTSEFARMLSISKCRADWEPSLYTV